MLSSVRGWAAEGLLPGSIARCDMDVLVESPFRGGTSSLSVRLPSTRTSTRYQQVRHLHSTSCRSVQAANDSVTPSTLWSYHQVQRSSRRSKNKFCTKQSPWSFTTWKSAASISPYHSRPLRSGHCQLLNSYEARITSGISDVCLEFGVAPHSVEHLFNCQSHPTQLTVQDLWDNPAAVADFLNLDSWR